MPICVSSKRDYSRIGEEEEEAEDNRTIQDAVTEHGQSKKCKKNLPAAPIVQPPAKLRSLQSVEEHSSQSQTPSRHAETEDKSAAARIALAPQPHGQDDDLGADCVSVRNMQPQKALNKKRIDDDIEDISVHKVNTPVGEANSIGQQRKQALSRQDTNEYEDDPFQTPRGTAPRRFEPRLERTDVTGTLVMLLTEMKQEMKDLQKQTELNTRAVQQLASQKNTLEEIDILESLELPVTTRRELFELEFKFMKDKKLTGKVVRQKAEWQAVSICVTHAVLFKLCVIITMRFLFTCVTLPHYSFLWYRLTGNCSCCQRRPEPKRDCEKNDGNHVYECYVLHYELDGLCHRRR